MFRTAAIAAVIGAILGLILGLLAPIWSPQLFAAAPEGPTWVVIELVIVLSSAFGGISVVVSGFFPNTD